MAEKPDQPQQPPIQIMQSVTINPTPEFSPDAKIDTSLAIGWNNWQADFEMYSTASGISDQTSKRTLLLYQAGPRVREIFKQIPDTGTDADYDIAKQKLYFVLLKTYFDLQKNRGYEVYQLKQITGR